MPNIFSVPILFLFGDSIVFSTLFFISPRFFIFIMSFFLFFSCSISEKNEWMKKKWTLILFKVQKITLFSLMNGMSCTYTARTNAQSYFVRVCVWNSKYQCSMYEIWYAWRASANIKCNLFYFIGIRFCHIILPDTDRLHLCIHAMAMSRCQLALSTIIPKSNEMWLSLFLYFTLFTLCALQWVCMCIHKIIVWNGCQTLCWCYNFHALKQVSGVRSI